MLNGVIAGPTLCGKSTLAKKISAEYWRQRGIVSYVFDIFKADWGPHAWVVNDREFFWDTVWKKEGGLVIVDDGSATIARDKDLIPIFTMMRHNHHRLLAIVHDSSDLLPSMRRNVDTMFLFRQTEDGCEGWYDVAMDKGVYGATELGRYEFIEWHSFEGCRRHPEKPSGPAPAAALPLPPPQKKSAGQSEKGVDRAGVNAPSVNA